MTRIGVVLLVLSLALGARAWMLWDGADNDRLFRGEAIDRTAPLVVGGIAAVMWLSGVIVVAVSEARKPLPALDDPTP